MEQKPAKQKVLLVITKSNFGGAQRYVYDLAIDFHKRGYTVAVACGGNGELVEKLQAANIKTYCVQGFQRDVSFMQEIQALKSLTSIIKSYNPDTIHLNSAKAGLWGSVVGRVLGVPRIIFTAHGWPFLEPRKLWWRIVAWAGSYLTGILSHHIIVVSQNDLKKTNMPFVTSKCTVIHTAIAPTALLSRDEARAALLPQETILTHQQNLWLVTNAELNHNKNHTAAIDGVAEFNSTHTTKIFYLIIGTGDLLQTLKEQVELKGLNEHVLFLGYIQNAQQYLLAFDVFLLPSKKEGLPYALLEAGLAGLPCIASRVGGIPEVIHDKKSGLLINPDNHMSIVEALDYLLSNPDKRSAYSNALSEQITTQFSLNTMIEKTENIYTL